ncbi:universal stress protein [Gryllotalpicola reticulitermitis]|uniref:Universal stress protein n=1 Tax=Gryllotalpicola reticulitermitis TaxID=1184153 RepID=A0ABV8QA44_9MICO
MSREGSRPVVVGLAKATPDRVLDEAIAMARDLGTRLACVYVDENRVPIGEAPDGTVITAPIGESAQSAQLIDRLAGSRLTERVVPKARAANVTLTFHTLAGDPVTAIARFAVDRNARLIVVGTRRPGVRASLSLLLAGPVASRLARRQPVPVLVVPLHRHSPLPSIEADRPTAASADVPDPADVLFGEGHA